MRLYLISLAVGLAVGLFYGLIGVRSPAPPAIALLGLLGMLAGERVVPIVRSHVFKLDSKNSAARIEVAGRGRAAADKGRSDAHSE